MYIQKHLVQLIRLTLTTVLSLLRWKKEEFFQYYQLSSVIAERSIAKCTIPRYKATLLYNCTQHSTNCTHKKWIKMFCLVENMTVFNCKHKRVGQRLLLGHEIMFPDVGKLLVNMRVLIQQITFSRAIYLHAFTCYLLSNLRNENSYNIFNS